MSSKTISCGINSTTADRRTMKNMQQNIQH